VAQSNASKAVAQDAIGAVATWFSLHTGDPGTTGANEGAGTGYARGQTVWSAANAGAGTKAGSQATIGAAAQAYTHWGFWTAPTGGTFHIGGVLPAPESYGAPGQYLLTPTMT
jgi:hypothetical protein